jgi:hypothetical protein
MICVRAGRGSAETMCVRCRGCVVDVVICGARILEGARKDIEGGSEADLKLIAVLGEF